MALPARFIPAFAASLLAVGGCVATSEQPTPAPLPEGSSLGVPMGQRPPGATLQPAVPRIAIAGDPTLGAPDAPVTIVEFMDYECPFCQGFARDTFPLLKQHYIETGKVRYVARDFPLPKHSRARPAATAAACAGEQGRYWEMREALLAAAGQLRDEDFAGHVRRLGLDIPAFDACRGEPRHLLRLDQDFAEARALGVSGTPTFLVGASAGRVARGRLLQGDEDYAAFEKVLAGYLTPRE